MFRVGFFSGLQMEGDAEVTGFQQNCKAHQHVPLLCLSALRQGLACFASGCDCTSLLIHCLRSIFDGQDTHFDGQDTQGTHSLISIFKTQWSQDDHWKIHFESTGPYVQRHCLKNSENTSFVFNSFAGLTEVGGYPLNSSNQERGVCLGTSE